MVYISSTYFLPWKFCRIRGHSKQHKLEYNINNKTSNWTFRSTSVLVVFKITWYQLHQYKEKEVQTIINVQRFRVFLCLFMWSDQVKLAIITCIFEIHTKYKMSFTYRDIFSDLRSEKVTPSRSNSEKYLLSVYSWLISNIIVCERGYNLYCETLCEWLQKFSKNFKDEASKRWDWTNGTWRDIERKYKVFLDHPVEFPGSYKIELFQSQLSSDEHSNRVNFNYGSLIYVLLWSLVLKKVENYLHTV